MMEEININNCLPTDISYLSHVIYYIPGIAKVTVNS